jgi:hypothetical protein
MLMRLLCIYESTSAKTWIYNIFTSILNKKYNNILIVTFSEVAKGILNINIIFIETLKIIST